jgi:uncharacterized Zn finger protein
MCKHVAATLYAVGARLDHEPDVLFTLRGVDPAEMVEAAPEQPPRVGKSRRGRVLAADELSSVFGVDIDTAGASAEVVAPPVKRGRRAARTKKKGKHSPAARKPASRAKGGKKKPAAKKRASAKKKTKKK